MIIAVIWGLIVGNTVQLQFKYDHCKSQEFVGEYCKVQKNLSTLDKK